MEYTKDERVVRGGNGGGTGAVTEETTDDSSADDEDEDGKVCDIGGVEGGGWVGAAYVP